MGCTNLFAASNEFINQHSLPVLRILQLLPQLLILRRRERKSKHQLTAALRPRCQTGNNVTSSSAFSDRAFSPSASCFCSAARARESKTSSSLDRMTHSKCRSRSSYWRRTSFRRSRTLEVKVSVNNLEEDYKE